MSTTTAPVRVGTPSTADSAAATMIEAGNAAASNVFTLAVQAIRVPMAIQAWMIDQTIGMSRLVLPGDSRVATPSAPRNTQPPERTTK